MISCGWWVVGNRMGFDASGGFVLGAWVRIVDEVEVAKGRQEEFEFEFVAGPFETCGGVTVVVVCGSPLR